MLGNHQYDVEVLGFVIETANQYCCPARSVGLAAELKGTAAADDASAFTRLMDSSKAPGLPPAAVYNATCTLFVPDPNEAR